MSSYLLRYYVTLETQQPLKQFKILANNLQILTKNRLQISLQMVVGFFLQTVDIVFLFIYKN